MILNTARVTFSNDLGCEQTRDFAQEPFFFRKYANADLIKYANEDLTKYVVLLTTDHLLLGLGLLPVSL